MKAQTLRTETIRVILESPFLLGSMTKPPAIVLSVALRSFAGLLDQWGTAIIPAESGLLLRCRCFHVVGWIALVDRTAIPRLLI